MLTQDAFQESLSAALGKLDVDMRARIETLAGTADGRNQLRYFFINLLHEKGGMDLRDAVDCVMGDGMYMKVVQAVHAQATKGVTA